MSNQTREISLVFVQLEADAIEKVLNLEPPFPAGQDPILWAPDIYSGRGNAPLSLPAPLNRVQQRALIDQLRPLLAKLNAPGAGEEELKAEEKPKHSSSGALRSSRQQ
jgi:hypothetical protein